ncbi:RNA 2'-O-ribose methyltransferase mtfA [Klebsiella pneumoniae]|uniref:RNA 2'-O-ribose methyltransferase mtfA n=1 Tax=Klebsiella pneumoniae TaxID=573 RepID=A0A2X3CSA7_KLEPN|nr:RNA 2'-O-ribose methyltransferase mtfA [Klebsiella pneumoniae]
MKRCRRIWLYSGQLDEHGVNAQIQARQLYHDREEVTVHVRRLWPPSADVATSVNPSPSGRRRVRVLRPSP